MSINADFTGNTILADSVTTTTAPTVPSITLGSSTGPTITFGTGAPTASAPQGSVYIRTDGSSTSTRMYINTTGSTTWTNFTTAA